MMQRTVAKTTCGNKIKLVRTNTILLRGGVGALHLVVLLHHVLVLSCREGMTQSQIKFPTQRKSNESDFSKRVH